MSSKILPLMLVLTIGPALWAQSTQTVGRGQTRAARRQEMTEMHKLEVESMKAEVAKMKASLAEMKANLFTITDTNQMARWRNNVDLWETMIAHMERMVKLTESMGLGSMGRDTPGPAIVAPPPSSPAATKPE